MKRAVRKILGFSFLLQLAACSEGPQDVAQHTAQTLPQRVSVRPLTEIGMQALHSAPAQVLSTNESRLSAEIAARIVELPVDVGQSVRKHAIVARLDNVDAQLGVARAQAAMEQTQARWMQAKAQLGRAYELRKQNFYSAEALTQRETEVAVLQASLKSLEVEYASAKRTLEKTIVRAPFDAIVKARAAQLGELAAPGFHLITLLEQSRMEIAAQVQPDEKDGLRSADRIVFVGALGKHDAKVLRISPAINRESRNIEVRLSARDVAPGEEGHIEWRSVALSLPAEYVSRRDGRYGVFVLQQDQAQGPAKARFVELPQAQEGRPVVVDLPATTPIIVDGRHSLVADQAVQAVQAVGR